MGGKVPLPSFRAACYVPNGNLPGAARSPKKYRSKGGTYRKWYGNNDYIVNWKNDGEEIRNNYDEKGKLKSRPQNMDFYFKEGMTWSTISSGSLAMRYSPKGNMFETKGSVCFPNDNSYLKYLLGLMNTPIVSRVLSVLSPTLDFHEGPLGKVPVIIADDRKIVVDEIVEQNIKLVEEDWDSYENSMNFLSHPLVRHRKSRFLFEVYHVWEDECESKFCQLKENEEKLNDIFLNIYHMENEISSEVKEEEISFKKADLQRDIKSLLSYAVGCMFGRYSLDVEGLAYAGGTFDNSKYSTFIPDVDGIIPITDEEYLEDDIVGLFCAWLKKVYGEETLEENLDFIAKALGKKGNSSREIIRNYFLTDFYKDHCSTYSVTGSGKRPIYWLFDSGKQNGFKALIYLHRYTPDTIGNLRVDYLHRMQRVYESEMNRMQDMIEHSTNSREVAAASKRKEKLQKQLKECREYDEKIGHLALDRVELDLDDGVKYNYRKVQTGRDGKFYEVLADSKAIMMDAKKYAEFKK